MRGDQAAKKPTEAPLPPIKSRLEIVAGPRPQAAEARLLPPFIGQRAGIQAEGSTSPGPSYLSPSGPPDGSTWMDAATDTRSSIPGLLDEPRASHPFAPTHPASGPFADTAAEEELDTFFLTEPRSVADEHPASQGRPEGPLANDLADRLVHLAERLRSEGSEALQVRTGDQLQDILAAVLAAYLAGRNQ